MPFDKRTFNKQIKNHLTEHGFTPHRNRKDYFIDCDDGLTRLVIRVPDGVHGVFIGAQFADRWELTGNFSDTVARWYVCETVLNGAMVMDYTEADIAVGLSQVTDALGPYITGGKDEVAAHLNDFYTNDLDNWTVVGQEHSEQAVDELLVYFGFPPVDPYSDSYFHYTLSHLRTSGGTVCMSIEEYMAHKAFYDRYTEQGCTISIDEHGERVWLTM